MPKPSGNVVVMCLALALGGCASSAPARPDNICSVFSEKRSWYRAATRAQKKWGTSMHIPMAFMNQESAFKSRARPPRTYLLGFIPWRRASSAYGYAQAIDGTWAQYQKATGAYRRKRNKFADATDFIHWYIKEANKRNGIATSDAYNLYLNYHEGPAGFARGTHKKKAWLLPVAKRVQNRADTYRSQYAQCEQKLKPGFWERLIYGSVPD